MDISNTRSIYKRNGYSARHKPSIVKDRLTRILLNNPDGTLTKYRLSKISNCKFPTVHRTLKKFEEMALIKGTKVTDIRKLMLSGKNWELIPAKKEYLIQNPI